MPTAMAAQPLPAWQAVDPAQVQQLQIQQEPIPTMPVTLAHTATLKMMKSQTRTINRARSYQRTKKEQMLQQMLNMCKEATNAPICRHWKAGGKCSFGMRCKFRHTAETKGIGLTALEAEAYLNMPAYE